MTALPKPGLYMDEARGRFAIEDGVAYERSRTVDLLLHANRNAQRRLIAESRGDTA